MITSYKYSKSRMTVSFQQPEGSGNILMPRLDGISATKRIIQDDPFAKIIVISAVGKSGLEKECLVAGAKEFIVKPFKVRELLNSIDTLVK